MIKSFKKYLKESNQYLDELDVFQDYVDEFGSVKLGDSVRRNGFCHRILDSQSPLMINIWYDGDDRIDVDMKIHGAKEFLNKHCFPRIIGMGNKIAFKIKPNDAGSRSSIQIIISKKAFHDPDRVNWNYLP